MQCSSETAETTRERCLCVRASQGVSDCACVGACLVDASGSDIALPVLVTLAAQPEVPERAMRCQPVSGLV